MTTADSEAVPPRPFRRTLLWLAIIVGAGALLRFLWIGSEPFWIDEAHSANYTRLSLAELWSFDDPFDRSNPPGYILALKAWAQLGRSDVWLRASSVFAGILTLPLVYLLGRRIADRWTALVATAFLALSGYHLRFSQEARAYAVLTLCAAVVMLAVAQLITEPDGDEATRVRGSRPWTLPRRGQGLRRPVTWTDLAWPAYALAAGAVFHLHNTGIALLVAANITVGVYWFRATPKPPRFLRNWIIANLGAVAIWLLWVPGFLAQLRLVTDSWWVPAPTLLSVAEGGADLLAPSFGLGMPWNGQTWGAVALLAGGFAVMWLGTRRLASRYRLLVWAFLLTLPVMELAYSLRRPVFLTRTLLWVLIPASIALAAAATRALRPRWSMVAVTALLAVAGFGAYGYHSTYHKTAWDRAAEIVATGASAGDVVLIQPASTVVGFDHYFDRTGVEIDEFAVPTRIPDRIDRGSTVTETDRRQVAELAAGYSTVWLVMNQPPPGSSLVPTLEELAVDSHRTRIRDLEILRFDMAPAG